MKYISPLKIKQVLYLILLIILGSFLATQMKFVLPALLGAITFYMLIRKFHVLLIKNYKLKKWLAALILLVGSLLIIVLPVIGLATYATNLITPFIQDPSTIKDIFEKIHQFVLSNFQIEIFDQSFISKYSGNLMSYGQSLLGSTVSFLTTLMMMYFILYYMLVQSDEMESWLRKSIPLSPKNRNRLITQTKNIIYSNAISIPLIALLQGVVGSIGYGIIGVNNAILLGILTAVGSVIPIVGTAIVYVPLAIYLFAISQSYQAIAVLFWGVVVIGISDNVARFALAKKLANIHPLITIFGVIIGVNIFGFLGVIFGPFIIFIFIELYSIYFDEFIPSSSSTSPVIQPTLEDATIPSDTIAPTTDK